MRSMFWLLIGLSVAGCSRNPCDVWRDDVAETYEACGITEMVTVDCPNALMDSKLEDDQDQVDCVAACDNGAGCEALDGSDADAADALDACREACNAGA